MSEYFKENPLRKLFLLAGSGAVFIYSAYTLWNEAKKVTLSADDLQLVKKITPSFLENGLIEFKTTVDIARVVFQCSRHDTTEMTKKYKAERRKLLDDLPKYYKVCSEFEKKLYNISESYENVVISELKIEKKIWVQTHEHYHKSQNNELLIELYELEKQQKMLRSTKTIKLSEFKVHLQKLIDLIDTKREKLETWYKYLLANKDEKIDIQEIIYDLYYQESQYDYEDFLAAAAQYESSEEVRALNEALLIKMQSITLEEQ